MLRGSPPSPSEPPPPQAVASTPVSASVSSVKQTIRVLRLNGRICDGIANSPFVLYLGLIAPAAAGCVGTRADALRITECGKRGNDD